MTPKEKCDELIEKFSPQCYCFLGSGMLTNTQNDEVQLRNAIQCSIICCKEILGYMGADRGYEFWTNVLYELEHYEP